MPPRNDLDWTEDEHILALDLYFRIPYSTLSSKHPSVIELSDLLNRLPIHSQALRGVKFRNPNGVYMKLGNFLRHDPSDKRKGLSRGAKGEELVWNLYAGNLPELREIANAIRTTGERQIHARLTQPLDEGEETFPEGRLLTREHKTRERNRQLVQRKKKAVLQLNGSLECEVCRFDFFKTYGKLRTTGRKPTGSRTRKMRTCGWKFGWIREPRLSPIPATTLTLLASGTSSRNPSATTRSLPAQRLRSSQ